MHGPDGGHIFQKILADEKSSNKENEKGKETTGEVFATAQRRDELKISRSESKKRCERSPGNIFRVFNFNQPLYVAEPERVSMCSHVPFDAGRPQTFIEGAVCALRRRCSTHAETPRGENNKINVNREQ